MAWWREARFGMFIHWGIYSVLGGEWEGKAGAYGIQDQSAPMPVSVGAKNQCTQHAFVERIGDECRANDIPYFLEFVGYDPAGGDEKSLEYAKKKPEVVMGAMAELGRAGLGPPSPKSPWQAAQLSANSCRPASTGAMNG